MSMYADDSTIYLSETNIRDLNTKLVRELQSVVDCISSNKLISISKTTSLVVGTAYSLQSKPKLDLSLNQTLVKQVEEAKLS